jgi:UDP-GlcNAc:undecaprenyl-phosphate GlcNAc-1-phosphate transferase
VTFAATPLAIALARRTGFLDHPVGYKAHREATPYLGGAAVFLGFIVASLMLGSGASRFLALVVCAAALLGLGTLDDRIGVRPIWRVLAEVGSAVVLYESGLGWGVFSAEWANLLVTVVWIVGLVNAFNLLDNLDGAAGSVAAVSAAGIGVLALVRDDVTLGALALSITGACLGFLPRNLAQPARIFLGDGGSMSVGFLVAGAAMAAVNQSGLGDVAILAAALVVGVPILDTSLVVLSRWRAGVSPLTAGRDHLTHRLLGRLESPRRVAVLLATTQAVLCAAAIGGHESGRVSLAVLAAVCAALGIAVVVVLESATWRPERPSSTAPTGTDRAAVIR